MTRTQRTGLEPVRRFVKIAGAAAALAAAPVFFPAGAQAAVAATSDAQATDEFTRPAKEGLLWFRDGAPSAAIAGLLNFLSTASVDGLDPADYDVEEIERAVQRAWGGKKGAVRKADRLLSRALAAYARDLAKKPGEGLQYLDPALKSSPPSASELLQSAWNAPSLAKFVAEMQWMNPAYAPLRKALVERGHESDSKREVLAINLARARALPAAPKRHVVVNAAAQKLHMYERGRLVGSMNVVVGKQREKDKTPMMASLLRTASLNPFWNVPPDLAAERIAPNAVKYGLGYLKRHGYQVLSDWSDDAELVDPETVDWQAVADGTADVRVRQVPGPGNALGKVKFTFPNPFAVYLHDTPDKKLLNEETRLFSGGCIRLEDAARFGEWLFGRELEATTDAAEIEVTLDDPVPVYVTYMTAVPDGSQITFYDDVYGWDEQRLALAGASSGAAAIR